jgi:hypothetical protein
VALWVLYSFVGAGDRMSGRLPPETLTLPVDAARLKAREILYQFPQAWT